jgi:threonyl-tRNA synthetase
MSKKEKLQILRHSAAHLLGHAVLELYPDTQLTLGPPTKDGFFYDFLPTKNFKEEDLSKIEAKMHELANQSLELKHEQIDKAKAREIYKDNPFKIELIDGIPGDTVGLSSQGDFYDLCRGGHVESTAEIKHFKLTSISGSYWRADRDGQPLQRISGTAFLTEEDQKADAVKKEIAERYSHRRLGKELDLFSFQEEGPGFPFFHPKGQTVFNELIRFMRNLQKKANYTEIATPTMLSDELWHRSGHYDHYKDNMYFSEIDEKTFAIKPMNCPGAILIYKNRPRSYKELPLKLSEYGKVHRHELSGVLNGLLRVRAFTQDDAHIFCTPDQIEEQIIQVANIAFKMFKAFGFDDVKVAISTRPKKAMGSKELWDKATNALKAALEKEGIKYIVQEGDGAFYGPKIDMQIKDSMGREWQCGTIQVDFFQAKNFDLSYINSSGNKEKPVIIHHALYGSLERFFAVLLEHHKGNLPFVVSPIQVKILTITDEQKDYAQEIFDKLKSEDLRVELDSSSDPISAKIKIAQLERVPWMVVVGNKEKESKTITLRHLDGKQKFGLTVEDIVENSKKFNL